MTIEAAAENTWDCETEILKAADRASYKQGWNDASASMHTRLAELAVLLREAQENDEGCNNLGDHWHRSVKAALTGLKP